jgi:hypothetical protein
MEGQTILEGQIAATLGLNNLRSGRHIVRDQQRSKTREVSVLGIWAAHILPSLFPPATVAVVMEEQRALGAFAVVVGLSRTWDTVSVVDVQFAPEWVDPVADVLTQTNLFDLEGGLCPDGISYELHIDTFASKSQIHFATPSTQSLIELEQAVFRVANEVVALAGGPLEKRYLDTWQDHLAR